jgi:hypothetical protein
MWNVERPPFDAEATFATCIDRVQDEQLKQRLVAIANHIGAAAIIYAERAGAAELHLIPQTNGVAGSITTDEMVKVYDQRMAGKSAPGRHIYDAIKLLPKHGICPYCDHRPVSTLDHLLPKRFFPSLAVCPDNLVGACADCNKTKLAFAPTTAEEVVLHPYFDNIEAGRWLTAEVNEGAVASVIFRTQQVDFWPETLNDRVRRQFQMLGLKRLYGAQAAREISNLAKLVGDIHNSRGANGVTAELLRQAETREAVRLNSWQAVFFRALSENLWYCNGGFRVV